MKGLQEQFVSVRLVQMKGVSLTQFQFDYDLTWAVFFLNADGTIYGRYGTRSVAGPMAHLSMESLKNAMIRALQRHRNYPKNRASLEGKRGPEPRWKTALEIPALRKKFRNPLMQPTGHMNCIHCHNIYDGWHETAYDEGSFLKESTWRYPLPFWRLEKVRYFVAQVDVESSTHAGIYPLRCFNGI